MRGWKRQEQSWFTNDVCQVFVSATKQETIRESKVLRCTRRRKSESRGRLKKKEKRGKKRITINNKEKDRFESIYKEKRIMKKEEKTSKVKSK